MVLVGNPVREAIAKLGETPFPPFDEYAPFKILVTGGSQGATVLSKVVPEGLGLLSPSLRLRLQVMQQCRPDDIDAVRTRYADLGIPAELMTYIEDMPAKLAEAHLVIAPLRRFDRRRADRRGRPAILIPYPEATDDHQTANASDIAEAGGARMIHQPTFTPDRPGQADRGDGGRPAGADQRGGPRAFRREARTPRATSPTSSSGSAAGSRRSKSASA